MPLCSYRQPSSHDKLHCCAHLNLSSNSIFSSIAVPTWAWGIQSCKPTKARLLKQGFIDFIQKLRRSSCAAAVVWSLITQSSGDRCAAKDCGTFHKTSLCRSIHHQKHIESQNWDVCRECFFLGFGHIKDATLECWNRNLWRTGCLWQEVPI